MVLYSYKGDEFEKFCLLLVKNICMGVMLMDKKLDEKELLQKQITKIVEKIENVWILSQILRCIQNITKEG